MEKYVGGKYFDWARINTAPVATKWAIASRAATDKRGRVSASGKAEVVHHLLRSEYLELLSRELSVIASALSLWRDRFLQAGQASVKCKTGELDERDEQTSKLKMAKEKSQDGIDLSEKKTIMKRLWQWNDFSGSVISP